MVRCSMVIFRHSYFWFSIVNQILHTFPIVIKRNMPHLKSPLLINIILSRKQKKEKTTVVMVILTCFARLGMWRRRIGLRTWRNSSSNMSSANASSYTDASSADASSADTSAYTNTSSTEASSADTSSYTNTSSADASSTSSTTSISSSISSWATGRREI